VDKTSVWCGFLSERHEEIKGAGPVVSQQQIRGPTTVHALGYEGPQLLYNASPMTPPLVKVSVHAESEETTRKSPRKLNLAIQISRVWCNFYPGLHKTQEPHDRAVAWFPAASLRDQYRRLLVCTFSTQVSYLFGGDGFWQAFNYSPMSLLVHCPSNLFLPLGKDGS
jgi:hypothetical protein